MIILFKDELFNLNYLISIATLILILLFKEYLVFKNENNVQDFHKKPTSRLGRLIVILGFCMPLSLMKNTLLMNFLWPVYQFC